MVDYNMEAIYAFKNHGDVLEIIFHDQTSDFRDVDEDLIKLFIGNKIIQL